jgi:hypothetical protein
MTLHQATFKGLPHLVSISEPHHKSSSLEIAFNLSIFRTDLNNVWVSVPERITVEQSSEEANSSLWFTPQFKTFEKKWSTNVLLSINSIVFWGVDLFYSQRWIWLLSTSQNWIISFSKSTVSITSYFILFYFILSYLILSRECVFELT